MFFPYVLAALSALCIQDIGTAKLQEPSLDQKEPENPHPYVVLSADSAYYFSRPSLDGTKLEMRNTFTAFPYVVPFFEENAGVSHEKVWSIAPTEKNTLIVASPVGKSEVQICVYKLSTVKARWNLNKEREVTRIPCTGRVCIAWEKNYKDTLIVFDSKGSSVSYVDLRKGVPVNKRYRVVATKETIPELSAYSYMYAASAVNIDDNTIKSLVTCLGDQVSDRNFELLYDADPKGAVASIVDRDGDGIDLRFQKLE